MRLLLVTNDFPPKAGGIQQYLGNLVSAYPGTIHVLAPGDPAAAPDAGVTRHTAKYMWPTRATGDWVVEQAGAFGPDAVLFGAPYPLAYLGPGLRAELGVPFGVLAHGAEVTLPAAAPGPRQLVAKALRDADARFAVSEFTAARVRRLTGLDAHHLGAGVDTATFEPPPEGGHEIPVVGCVSRFVPRKGQHRLLKAVARLDRPAQVLLVGKGRMEPDLRRLSGRLGVDTRFVVDPPWEELPGLYRSMDVFCMPCTSRWGGLEVEGLGLVFLEASATGLPVLAGASGGAPETVVPGETGFVVHSVSDIVEGLMLLLDDPERAAAMGRAGRSFVASRFSWEQVVDRVMEAFAGVR